MKHQIRVFVTIKKTKFATGQIVSLKITKTTSQIYQGRQL